MDAARDWLPLSFGYHRLHVDEFGPASSDNEMSDIIKTSFKGALRAVATSWLLHRVYVVRSQLERSGFRTVYLFSGRRRGERKGRRERWPRSSALRAVSQHGNEPRLESLLKYIGILAPYRHERGIFPPAHPSHARAEADIFRSLQTNPYPHGSSLHAVYCTICPATYIFRAKPHTLLHVVWEGFQTPHLIPS